MSSFEVFAPGRTELAGNHVDHQGGVVLTAATAQGMRATCETSGNGEIRIESKGFEPICLNSADALSHPGPRPEERGTSLALVRGMFDQLVAAGFKPCGISMRITSEIASGGGLSSSAAYELLIGCALREAFEYRGVSTLNEPLPLALAAMHAEREYFGKPCGCMDQAAIALGGIQLIDFANPQQPTAQRIDASFAELGLSVVLVDTGVTHDDASSQADYASIPTDMCAVAQALQAQRLGQLDSHAFEQNAATLRIQLGKRPVLRAQHYFDEVELVRKRAEALQTGDADAFIAATCASGQSSIEHLQNIGPALPALERVQAALPAGSACRIHGGGFGGYIQAFVPTCSVEQFIERVGDCMVIDLTTRCAGVIR